MTDQSLTSAQLNPTTKPTYRPSGSGSPRFKLPFDYNEHKTFDAVFCLEKKNSNDISSEIQFPSPFAHQENSFFDSRRVTENIWRIARLFIGLLKQKTSFYKFNEYEAQIHKFLHDSVFFTRQELGKGGSREKFSRRFDNRLFRYLWNVLGPFLLEKTRLRNLTHVWNPYAPLKLFWDIFLFCIIIVEFLLIPMEIAFGLNNECMDFLIVIVLVVNALISLNTAYYFRGSLVTNRKHIVQNYANKFLVGDCLVLLVYWILIILKLSNVDLSFVCFSRLIFYLNNPRFSNIHAILDEKFKLYYRLHGFLEIFELVSFSLFIIHLFACGFFWISVQSCTSQAKTWISAQEIDASSWQDGYSSAFYWATITIMTVGYGDVTPQNPFERLYVILTAIMGCGVFAFNVSTIGRICEKMYQDNENFKEKNKILTDYMVKKKIDEKTQLKIKAYLRYYWTEAFIQNEERESEVLNMLTKALRNELIYEANSKILYGLPLFYSNFSERSIRKTIPFLKETRYSPGDVIFQEKEKDEEEIYIISKGKVELLYRKENSDLMFINSYDKGFFGEYSFFTGLPRNSVVRSKDFTTLFSLKRADFLSVIREEPDDYFRFCMLRDEILLSNSNFQQRKPCIACRKFGHRIELCPLVHFIPNKEAVVRRHFAHNTSQKRAHSLRTRVRKANTLGQLRSNLFRLAQFLKNEMSLDCAFEHEENEDQLSFNSNGEEIIHRLLFNPNRIRSSSSNNLSVIGSPKNLTSRFSERYSEVDDFERIHGFKTYYPHHNFSVAFYYFLKERMVEMKRMGMMSSLIRRTGSVATFESGKTGKTRKRKEKIHTTLKRKFYSSKIEIKEKVSLYELVNLVMENPKIKKQLARIQAH